MKSININIDLISGNDKGNRAATIGNNGSPLPLTQAFSEPVPGLSFKIITMKSQDQDVGHALQCPSPFSCVSPFESALLPGDVRGGA